MTAKENGNKIPHCVRCNDKIWGNKVGYFMINYATNKFDLYCESCWKMIGWSKDTV